MAAMFIFKGLASPTSSKFGLCLINVTMLAAVLFGVEVGMIRKLAATEHFATILLINNGAALLLLAIPAGLFWQTPSADQWLFLAGAGVSVVLGQMMFLTAMRTSEASFVAPFGYLTLVYAMLFGFVIFGEIPSISTLIGAVIITAAELFMLYREWIS